MTADGFARLLGRLDADADRAAEEYQRLHRALVKFFDWRGAWAPEECADEALDRLARRLEEETAIGSVRAYAHGIARLVLLERQRAPIMSPLDEVAELAQAPAVPPDDEERQRACFDRCLERMPPDERSIVTQYYEGERRTKILNRRRMATALGVTENALRIRVRRSRDKLERCVESCVAQRGDRW